MAAGTLSPASGAAAAHATAQAMMQQQAQAAQALGQPQPLQRIPSGSAGPSGVQPVVGPVSGQGLTAAAAMAAPQPSAQPQPAQPKISGGLPMAELIQVIREHPQLKSQIQEIVQRKDLPEPTKMAAIQRIVREAQPGSQP